MRRRATGLLPLALSAWCAGWVASAWGTIAFADPAGTAPASARLVYELGPGTETCPSEETLISDVAARLGYDPFRHDATRQVVVKIAAEGRAWKAGCSCSTRRDT